MCVTSKLVTERRAGTGQMSVLVVRRLNSDWVMKNQLPTRAESLEIRNAGVSL